MARQLTPGEIFAGFRVQRTLGAGGMGAVYAVEHPRLPRMLALKLLTADAADPAAAARFSREAEIIARLDHPGIVTVVDRGVERGTPWIAMQLVDGQDCTRALRANGPMPVEVASRVVGEVASALDAAHRSGVVHRDVKPANILLTRPQPGEPTRAVLTDFGISQAGDANLTAITGALGQSMATVAYAAPEQLSGRPVGPRSDQYALACTAVCLLTGRPPFEGDPVPLALNHLHADPPSVRERRPDLPAEVDPVLRRALAKDPQQRYRDCASFARELTQALAPQPVGGASPAPAAPARDGSARRWVWPAAAVATVVAIGAGVLLWDRDGEAGRAGITTSATSGATTSSTSATSTTGSGTTTTGPGAELALWSQAQPVLALWPQLLPQEPTSRGYQGMVCAPTTEQSAAATVAFRFKLECAAREEGFGKPSIDVDLLSYAPGEAARALQALSPPNWVPILTAAGRTVRAYHFNDPAEGTWILLVYTDEQRRDHHFQVGGKDRTYSQLYDWIRAAPF